jgi:hypothetical protein
MSQIEAGLFPAASIRGASPSEDGALLQLLTLLQAASYSFVTPTNGAIAVNREARQACAPRTLRDIFGWSLDFDRADLDPAIWSALEQAGALRPAKDRWWSTLRCSSVAGRLFLHSAYPTKGRDAVFLGPDSYRFARFIEAESRGRLVDSILDIGVGAGVGALVAAAMHPEAEVTGADLNPRALRLARINARHAGVQLNTVEADGLPPGDTRYDLIVANPPFISGREGRTYRDGGGQHGMEISMAWALGGAQRLARGGRMLLYTGSAIVDGVDPFREALHARLSELGRRLDYAEIDPDIFSSMLGKGDYENVERVAAVGASIQ